MSITPIQSSIPAQARRRRNTPASVLLVQRGEHGATGLLEAVLSEQGLSHRTVRLAHGDALPAPDTSPVAVLLGGDDLALGASPAIIDWAAAADRAGTRLFGIGTGAHALARALGADATRPGTTLRGWISVTSAAPELVPSGSWFAWSDRPLVPPPGAEVLAGSLTGVQAFRVRGHIGVQFHPQATPALIREWVDRTDAVLDHQGLEEATGRESASAGRAARRLFSAFLAPQGQALAA